MGNWFGSTPASGNIGSGWADTGQFGGGYGGYEGAIMKAAANQPVVQPNISVPTPAGGGGGFWGGLNAGNMMKTALPFAMLMGSNYVQGKKAKENVQQTAQQNQQVWQQNAYPRPAAVQAAASENRGQLGQARLGAYQNLASNLASRGWGSGSGLGVQGASNIERGYLQALGKQATDMTKFANTPMFGMPSQAYSSPVSGGTEQALSGMDSALGYYMMSQMLGR